MPTEVTIDHELRFSELRVPSSDILTIDSVKYNPAGLVHSSASACLQTLPQYANA